MKKRIAQISLQLKYTLAGLQRKRLNQVTFIGITGSAGKTTTKDLTATILGSFAPCRQSYLSYNTLASVAGTIWYTKKSQRYCVAEVAASGPGTMDLSARLLKPDIAVITRIGRDHYSAYKNMEALAAEKAKLVLALPKAGIAVLNMDDPLVRNIGEVCNRRVLWFGESAGADLRLLEAHSRWPEPLILIFEYRNKTYEVHTQLHGTYMAASVLAALGVALAADLPLDKAVEAAEKAKPSEGRMQIVSDKKGVVFIRDDFKAPGWTIQAPFEFLRQATAERKIAVIGTVSDATGDETEKYRKLSRQISEYVDLAFFVGLHAHRAVHANKNKITGFPNIQHAASYLQKELRKGDLVLLKGSHMADHLCRLFINRISPIRCWKDRCTFELFCDRCPELYKPSSEIYFPEPMSFKSGSAAHVVVGLGNPGLLYRRTLHNLGHRVLDTLAKVTGGAWQVRPEGWVCDIIMQGKVIHLFKPRTKMNKNGIMVRRFLERVGSDPQHCFIVYDDADLPLGNVRFKNTGGDAGHKGMRSVILALGTVDVQRLRLGIRRLGEKKKTDQFVLKRMSINDHAIYTPMIEKASAMVLERLQKHLGGEFIKQKM